MANTFLAATADHSEIIRPHGLMVIQVNTTNPQQRFVLQQARGELSDEELLDVDNAGEWADITARTDTAVFSPSQRVRQFQTSAGFAYRLFRYQGNIGATAHYAMISTWTRRVPGTR